MISESEATKALKFQIQAEMSKPSKDYNQLKQLKSKLQTQAAADEQAVALQSELQAAEGRGDFDRCEELQSQMEGLAMSVSSGAAPGTPGARQSEITPYNGPYAPGYNGGGRRQEIVQQSREGHYKGTGLDANGMGLGGMGMGYGYGSAVYGMRSALNYGGGMMGGMGMYGGYG